MRIPGELILFGTIFIYKCQVQASYKKDEKYYIYLQINQVIVWVYLFY